MCQGPALTGCSTTGLGENQVTPASGYYYKKKRIRDTYHEAGGLTYRLRALRLGRRGRVGLLICKRTAGIFHGGPVTRICVPSVDRPRQLVESGGIMDLNESPIVQQAEIAHGLAPRVVAKSARLGCIRRQRAGPSQRANEIVQQTTFRITRKPL